MKALGSLLLVLGIVGLLLNLIFWLPAEFNLVIMVLISILCLVAIWGGGKLALSQIRIEVAQEPVKNYESTTQPAQGQQQSLTCPKCGWEVVPNQRFCGACGSSLMSCCPTCGAAVPATSKFCANCGARLG
jgi:hypothetical protein